MGLKNLDIAGALSNVRPNPFLTIATLKAMAPNFLWQKGMTCPNRKLKKEDHDLNCTICDGTGFYYEPGAKVPMVIQGIGLQQQFLMQGRLDAGTATVTTLPETNLSYYDRLTQVNSMMRYEEPIQRSKVGLTDKTKYQILDVVMLVDQYGQKYAFKSDFAVSPEGHISWSGSKKPKSGDFFTIMYMCRPRYIVLSMLHETRDFPGTVNSMKKVVIWPKQAMVRLDYLWGEEQRK